MQKTVKMKDSQGNRYFGGALGTWEYYRGSIRSWSCLTPSISLADNGSGKADGRRLACLPDSMILSSKILRARGYI